MHTHDLTLLLSHDIRNDITNMNTTRKHNITRGLTRINKIRVRGSMLPKQNETTSTTLERRVPTQNRRYSFVYYYFDIVWILFRKYLKILAPI